MVVISTGKSETQRIQLFQHIERHIFLSFRMTCASSNRRNNEFFKLARSVNCGEASISDELERLQAAIVYAFKKDGSLETIMISAMSKINMANPTAASLAI